MARDTRTITVRVPAPVAELLDSVGEHWSTGGRWSKWPIVSAALLMFADAGEREQLARLRQAVLLDHDAGQRRLAAERGVVGRIGRRG